MYTGGYEKTFEVLRIKSIQINSTSTAYQFYSLIFVEYKNRGDIRTDAKLTIWYHQIHVIVPCICLYTTEHSLAMANVGTIAKRHSTEVRCNKTLQIEKKTVNTNWPLTL